MDLARNESKRGELGLVKSREGRSGERKTKGGVARMLWSGEIKKGKWNDGKKCGHSIRRERMERIGSKEIKGKILIKEVAKWKTGSKCEML